MHERGRAGRAAAGAQQPAARALGPVRRAVSGTAFTAPRHENRRTWLYRRQPSVVAGRYAPYAQPHWTTGGDRGIAAAARPAALGTRCRSPTRATSTSSTACARIAANGDADAQTGIAAHVYVANRSMERRAFVNADGEMLIVPQQGACVITTELGVLDVAARRDRADAARRGVQGRVAGSGCRRAVARLCLRELRRAVPPARTRADRLQRPGQRARLPGAGGRLRRQRRRGYELVKKFGGRFWTRRRRPLAVQRRRLARQPRAAEVRHRALHDHRLDQLRPSRPVDLHRADLAQRHARHGQLRLRDLPAALAGRWKTPSARPGTTAT